MGITLVHAFVRLATGTILVTTRGNGTVIVVVIVDENWTCAQFAAVCRGIAFDRLTVSLRRIFQLIAWSALYSDSTRDHRKRVRGIKYAQLASLCSVNVITVTEKMSHSLENFGVFQFICIGIGIISLCCLYMAGHLGGNRCAATAAWREGGQIGCNRQRRH
ncbi:hypothetical protein niasHS_014332 [Heterodera schachtii]|uniref:Uncharacterized protein n=2 Tax=Heterodera TaxID=34509 RepID=A0ABD2I3U9_HETSC